MMEFSTTTTPTTSMPNVEHLLQHYRVADVLHIQKRLKGDVEKRKTDLKTLIGERYNELLEATDSIEQMSSSVGNLIVSLKELGGVLGSSGQLEKVEKNSKNNSSRGANEYNEAVLSKILFDLPLQVWNALEQGKITLATYSYFYGLFLYRKLKASEQGSSKIEHRHHRLHFYNRRAIEDLSGHIVEHCWRRIAEEQRSASSEVDLSTFADIFSCIFLLETTAKNKKNITTSFTSIVEEFYRRQTENITSACSGGITSSLSALLETLLNIIMNTIKCSRIFYAEKEEENEQQANSLLPQRFNRLVTSTYSSFSAMKSSSEKEESSTLAKLPLLLQQYQIASDDSNGKVLFENATTTTKINLLRCPKESDAIEAWVSAVKTSITGILQAKVATYTSIRTLHSELSTTEAKLLKEGCFTEWEEEYAQVVDVQSVIWTECIKRAIFERRVGQLVQTALDQLLEAVNGLLTSSKAKLVDSETSLSLVEFTGVWRGSATVNSSNSNFQNLITSCCDLLNVHFEALYEDICPLAEIPEHTYLSAILSEQVFTSFLADLQERLNRLHLSDSSTNNQYILFGALLFERLADVYGQSNSSYRKLFERLSSSSTTTTLPGASTTKSTSTLTWSTVQTELKTISDAYFCRWFELVVSGHLVAFTPEHLVTLDSFLANLTAWERVPIVSGGSAQDVESSKETSAQREETLTTSSAVEVPQTISLSLQLLLESVCGDINRTTGYRLSRPVLHYIVQLLGEKVLAVYETAIKDSLMSQEQLLNSYPPAAKQTIAVQLYFDLLFLKNLFQQTSSSREANFDSVALKSQQKRLNELKALFEGGRLIDPFDLHIMFPSLVGNAERHLRACSVLFAFLFPERSLVISSKTPSQSEVANQTVRHNIMLAVHLQSN